MSLTSQLRDRRSPVAQFFRQHCPNVLAAARVFRGQLGEVRTLEPAWDRSAGLWGLIGHAVDYRIRYYFSIVPVHELVAVHGMSEMYGLFRQGSHSPRDTAHQALGQAWSGQAILWTNEHRGIPIPELALNFCDGLQSFLDKVAPPRRRLVQADEELLCRYCYVLALFEQVYREGLSTDSQLHRLSRGAKLDGLLALPPDLAVRDLRDLSSLFFERHSALTQAQAVLNPTFAGSRDVGGADADLIVDGCLIEIKTTINPKFDAGLFNQLLGYVLLDYVDAYSIRAVGVYLARQGALVTTPVDHLLRILTGDADLDVVRMRSLFQQAVHGEPR